MGMVSTMRVSASVLAVAVLLTLSACARDTGGAASVGERSGSPRQSGDAMVQQEGPLDALSITVHLRSDRVDSGGVVKSRLVVENNSDRTVVDPSCNIGGGRSGLVPVTDPDAELWVQPQVDCGGPYSMKPGFRDVWQGPEFYAHTKYGDALPPGEYLAMIEIDGLSARLSTPVTIQ